MRASLIENVIECDRMKENDRRKRENGLSLGAKDIIR